MLGLRCKITTPFCDKQTDGIYDVIDVNYWLRLSLFPSQEARVKFDNGVACIVKLLRRNFTASATSAINGNGVCLVEFCSSALHEVVALNVYIYA